MMEDADFNVIGLKNPLSKDYDLKWNKRSYIIPKGKMKLLPEWLAKHGAMKIARIYITLKWGFRQINNKDLMEKVMKALLTDVFESAKESKTVDDKLMESVEKINLEANTAEEPVQVDKDLEIHLGKARKEEPETDTLETEVLGDNFADLNVISETEDELRKEEMKVNKPIEARAEQLNELTVRDLQAIAKELKLEVKGLKKGDLINVIIEKEKV